MDFLKDAAEKVGLGGVVDKMEEMGQEALGKMFLPILDKSTESSLQFLGPKAGEIAVEKMTEKYKMLDKVSTAKDTAVDAASKAVMSFKDDILDFVQEATEDPQGTFKKVGVMLFRACKDAASQACKALLNLIPGCMAVCIKPFADLKEMIKNVYESCVEALKTFVNDQLKSRHVPQPIMDKIKWDFSPEDDIGQPKKKRAAAAPAAETMGASS